MKRNKKAEPATSKTLSSEQESSIKLNHNNNDNDNDNLFPELGPYDSY